MDDYLKAMSDSELANFAANFWTVLNVAPEVYTATQANADDMKAKTDGFSAELTKHIAAQAAAQAQTKIKNMSRKQLVSLIRYLVNQAKLHGASDADIARLGVPTTSSLVATNATRPIGFCKTGKRLQHELWARDEAAPGKTRLPKGVLGFEIHRKIGGAPPVDLKECEFLTLDTVPPYKVDYDGADAGKMVHYIFLWRFRDDSVSPISETISATVTG